MTALTPMGWRERLIYSPRADPETIAYVVATIALAQDLLDHLGPDPDAAQHRATAGTS